MFFTAFNRCFFRSCGFRVFAFSILLSSGTMETAKVIFAQQPLPPTQPEISDTDDQIEDDLAGGPHLQCENEEGTQPWCGGQAPGGGGMPGGGGGCGSTCSPQSGPGGTPLPLSPPPPNPWGVDSGSFVYTRDYNYTHWADDYVDPSGADVLTIRRYFRSRPRDMQKAGSFGPFMSHQYDLQIEFSNFNAPGSTEIPGGESTIDVNGQTNFTTGTFIGRLSEGWNASFNVGSMPGSNQMFEYADNGFLGLPSQCSSIEILNTNFQHPTIPGSEEEGYEGAPTGLFLDAKYIRITVSDRRVLLFECINTATYPAPEGDVNKYTHARLVRYQFPSGRAVTLTYKDNDDFLEEFPNGDALEDAPTRQWQIDTISDGQRTIQVGYHEAQIAGRWVISHLVFPGGRMTTYSYANNYVATPPPNATDFHSPSLHHNYLTSINHADGSQSTFNYSTGSNGLTRLQISDPVAEPKHRNKTVRFQSTTAHTIGEGTSKVVTTAWGYTRLIGSGTNEVTYANFYWGDEGAPQGDEWYETGLIYEGGGRMQTTGRSMHSRRYFDNWTLTASGNNYVFEGDLESQFESGAFSGVPRTDEKGNAFRQTFAGEVHSPNSVNSVPAVAFNWYEDGTFEAYSYLPHSALATSPYEISYTPLVTRFRDRLGNVTRYEYDSVGRVIKEIKGLRDGPSNVRSNSAYAGTVDGYTRYPSATGAEADFPSTTIYQTSSGGTEEVSAYAVRQFGYYAASHPTSAGMLEWSTDERGKRTDFEYDAGKKLTKIKGPVEQTGGTRPETVFEYDSTRQRLVKTISPDGKFTERFYDSMDRLTKILYQDGTSEQWSYGTPSNATGEEIGLLIKTIDRAGVITTYDYDAADRLVTKVTAAAKLDPANNNAEVPTPLVALIEEFTYVRGSNLVKERTVSGQRHENFYDYRNRLAETRVYPRVGTDVALITRQKYVDNQLLYREVQNGNQARIKTYFGYNKDNGRLLRTIQFTNDDIAGISLANNDAVLSGNRTTTLGSSNAIVTDLIRDAQGQVIYQIDPRGTISHTKYDGRGRVVSRYDAWGTPIQTQTDTIYDEASNVVEVRSPRYFDSADLQGAGKAIEQWTYTDNNQVKTHKVAAGDTIEIPPKEEYMYDLAGRMISHKDFEEKLWEYPEPPSDCCGHTRISKNPLGHGTITNANSLGLVVHSATVYDVATHSSDYKNPINAKTVSESTTRYDERRRPVYQTVWKTALGAINVDAPPIAGITSPVTAEFDGFTTQYLYDDRLGDGVGLEGSGRSVPKLGTNVTGNTTITLTDALLKLQAAGITFSAERPGRASVVINPEDEISFTISDGVGRTVMSGKLQSWKGTTPAPNGVVTWTIQQHDLLPSDGGTAAVYETRTIDAIGAVSKQVYDGAGRMLRSIDPTIPTNRVTSYEYDKNGNQTQVLLNGVGASFVYDALNRNTFKTDTAPTVCTTETQYDRSGNVVRQIDAKGKATIIHYDARNRRIRTFDRLDTTNGSVASGAYTEFQYRKTGQLKQLKDAEGKITEYKYDDAGNKKEEIYPDHVSGSAAPAVDYGTVSYVYDAANRVKIRTDQLGQTATYNYDLAGRMHRRDYRSRPDSPSGSIWTYDTYSFDRASRMLTAYSQKYDNTVTFEYDSIGRKKLEKLSIFGKHYLTQVAYTARNEVEKYTYPDGTEVHRTYHPDGNLHQVKLGSEVLDTRTYDANGRLQQSAYSNSNGRTTNFTYFSDNMVETITCSGAVADLTYSWDKNKNKTKELIQDSGGSQDGYGFDLTPTTFTPYDEEDRLKAWTRYDQAVVQTWNLSKVGDWSTFYHNGVTQTRAHSPAHELQTISSPYGTSNLSYDQKGNLTRDQHDRIYTYDHENRLAEIGHTVEEEVFNPDLGDGGEYEIQPVYYADYVWWYDATGRRVAERDAAGNGKVFVQVDQQTVADYALIAAVASLPSNPLYRYVWGSYVDELIVRQSAGTTASHRLFYHRNQQYSVYAVTNGNGDVVERYGYNPYGQITYMDDTGEVPQVQIGSTPIYDPETGEQTGEDIILADQSWSSIDNRYTYTGREYNSALKLYHFRARWYDPALGRFCSRDPIGYHDALSLYQIFLANPFNYLDPSGLSCVPQRHHWFPRQHRFRIETRCRSIGFNIDYFTTPLDRCSGEDSNCDVHGWIHGRGLPGRPQRSPDWNTEVDGVLNDTSTCCEFLIEMAAAIASAYAEIADEFEDCGQPPCYRLGTFRPPHNPEARLEPDTTKLFAEIVAACRQGRTPNRLPAESDVNQDGGGMLPGPTIDTIIFPARSLPRILPKVFPRALPPSTLPYPANPPIEIPPRRAA